ncbi:hypothetical protein [Pseudoalteromonas apostichopi]|uniref:hypothetical protein n=1 Tax=Pseudoalteromonas apostichopi TaxID=3035452 RepID=UPI00257384D0|nr:hypothetical protein [Pseudoalteromonas sp. FE4]
MYKQILLFIIFSGISLSAFGLAEVEICNNCSQNQTDKIARLSVNSDTKAVIVVDMINETALKYDTHYIEDRYGEPVVNVSLSELSNDELFDLDLLYEYRKELVRVITRASEKSMLKNGQSTQRNISTPKQTNTNANDNSPFGKEIEVKGSPYDFLLASYFRNDVYDFYFAGETSALTKILLPTKGTIKFPNINKLKLYVRINFYSDDLAKSQNGFISVTLNPVIKSFNILGGRDGFKNSIPLNHDEISGHDFIFATAKSEDKNESESNEQAKFERYTSSLDGGVSCRVVGTKTMANNKIYTYQC